MNYLKLIILFIFGLRVYLIVLYYIFYKNFLDKNIPQIIQLKFLNYLIKPLKALYKSSGISSSVVVFS